MFVNFDTQSPKYFRVIYSYTLTPTQSKGIYIIFFLFDTKSNHVYGHLQKFQTQL